MCIRDRRLGLASALLGEPPVLILDEPTNGLDPAGIHEIRNLIKTLPKRYNCTVLISSHMLSEIELLADDIGILNHGRLLFEGSLDDLKLTAHQAGFENDNLEAVSYTHLDVYKRQLQFRNNNICILAYGYDVVQPDTFYHFRYVLAY